MSVLLMNVVCNEQQTRRKRLRTSFTTTHPDTFEQAIGGGGATKIRHRKWKTSAQQKYTMFKKGLYISQREISTIFEEGRLTHDYLWYFVHKDPKIERADRIEPKWIVVLCTDDGVYLHPQQPYLTNIYKELGRTDYKAALTMMDDGTPYWVDTHIARVHRDRDAKRRYSEKHRSVK